MRPIRLQRSVGTLAVTAGLLAAVAPASAVSPGDVTDAPAVSQPSQSAQATGTVRMSFMSNASQTSISSVGAALETIARKNWRRNLRSVVDEEFITAAVLRHWALPT